MGHETKDFDPTNEQQVTEIVKYVTEKLLSKQYIFYVKQKDGQLVRKGGVEMTVGQIESTVKTIQQIVSDEENLLIGLKPVVGGG